MNHGLVIPHGTQYVYYYLLFKPPYGQEKAIHTVRLATSHGNMMCTNIIIKLLQGREKGALQQVCPHPCVYYACAKIYINHPSKEMPWLGQESAQASHATVSRCLREALIVVFWRIW